MTALKLDGRDKAEIRSHGDIVRTYGASRLREFLISKGFDLPNPTTTQRWAERDSIPSDYWKALASEKIATLEELASHAESRKISQPQSGAGLGAHVPA